MTTRDVALKLVQLLNQERELGIPVSEKEWLMLHDQAKDAFALDSRQPIYVAHTDEMPTLTLTPHEICDPDPLTSEEIVTMWKRARQMIVDLKKEQK